MKKETTPLMQQFHQFKSEHPDAILFMRCGDFYEMFYEDAKVVAKELQIVLTSRNKNSENPIPMAGIPHHSYEDYAARLIQKGYKIAICEQVEDPKTAKGIVKREVVQVITPGTVTLEGVLNPKTNNYLSSLHLQKKQIFFCSLDVSTGEGQSTFFSNNRQGLKQLLEELLRLSPSELLIHKKICDDPLAQEELLRCLLEQNISFQKFEKRISSKSPLYFEWIPARVLNASGLDRTSPQRFAWEIIFSYMEECSIHCELVSLKNYTVEEKLQLDPNTIRNLELVTSLYKENEATSLLGVLDQTVTAPGARLLKKTILEPLVNQEEIEQRLNVVEALVERPIELEHLRFELRQGYDLFRLVNRLLNQQANGRDLVAIRQSLAILPSVIQLLPEIGLEPPIDNTLEGLVDLISRALVEEPPAKVTEGNLFQKGYHERLDYYKDIEENADSVLKKLEEDEKEKSALKSLKVKFNKVFGYYFELPRSQSDKAPSHFIRKQTLTNAERYTSEELKQVEKDILAARDTVQKLEYQLFQDLRVQVLQEVNIIYLWAGFLASLDVLASFAHMAQERRFCRPRFTNDPQLRIEEGRHPVVEVFSSSFVPNDLYLNDETDLVHIITGPNMGGKSTYLRQTALLVLMAQIGSFVPASYYEAQIFDRIFTRVGASDDLAQGKSTFMVEMTETAYLLKNATASSLVLLDEVGRGTATFDGLSLAWSVIEYILQEVGCKTLFATHYHEITQINQLDTRVKNYCVSVLESQSEILFLHKIKRGSADRSYGIHVARLAGMPTKLLKQANQILKELESSKTTVIGLDTKSKKLCVQASQPGLIREKKGDSPKKSKTLENLRAINPDKLTPMDALQTLFELKEMLRHEN